MPFDAWSLLVGILLVGVALGGTLLRRLPITTAMIYLGVGMVLSRAGVFRLDPLDYKEALEHITEVVVLVSLFASGLKMRAPFHDRRWILPMRLATLTMMVSVALTALVGNLVLGLPLGAAVLLGAILAPTDPVLASDVQVEDTQDRSPLRFSLTGEASLNDGTAFPFVMLGLGLMGLHDLGSYGLKWLAVDVIWAVSIGLGVGWGMGLVVAKLTNYLRAREHALGYEEFLTLGLIGVAYGASHLMKGYGFLAVFAAGLALRHYEMRKVGEEQAPEETLGDTPLTDEKNAATDEKTGPAYMVHQVQGFTEQFERILELGMVLALGALLLYARVDERTVLFTGLMFFLVRPLAVWTTFFGPGIGRTRRWYAAWFGIRGVGSLYYLFYALAHGVPESVGRELLGVVLTVVAASILLHGLSATPLMTRYSRRFAHRG